LEIADKHFLVTGSSRGIGRSIAEKLLTEGARVGLVARSHAPLNETSNYFKNKFGEDRVDAWTFDLTKPECVEELKVCILSKWNSLDGLISNVGDGRSVPDPISTTEQWSSIWSQNFDSALSVSRAFLPLLQANNGNIVYISSICGVEALGAPVDYSVAKSALLSFSKNLARKVAPDVRVNAVAPGNVLFEGSSWEEKIENDSENVNSMIQSCVPMKRFGKPEEIADSVVFLCSKRSAFTTGACLVVDGGQTKSF
jgi:3-oxoacyl-[acyl-carrier protein] reductase